MKYEAIVIGTSSGGINAIKQITAALPADFGIPIIIVIHIGKHSDSQWISLLNEKCQLNVKEADEKEKIEPGNIYIAPPNYHLLIEKNKTLSFTIDERINFARPAIDILFESAAEAFRNALIGIVLTGANNDGAKGIQKIKDYGGTTIVEHPETAASPYMPESAIALIEPDHIVTLEKIPDLLINLNEQ